MSVGYGQVVNGVGGEIVVVYLKPSEFDFTSPLYLSPGGGELAPPTNMAPYQGFLKKYPCQQPKLGKGTHPSK